MSLSRWSIAAYVALVLLLLLHFARAQELLAASPSPSPSPSAAAAAPETPLYSAPYLAPSPSAEPTSQVNIETARASGSLIGQSDIYIARNQRQCFETRNLVSCIKYKASKLIWKLATNGMGFFPNEHERTLGEQQPRFLRIVQLGEPVDDIVVFNDAKSLAGDSELLNIFKFLKRAVETFGRNHGVQLVLPKGTAARVMDESDSRGARKKKKWLILLPLIILIKIAHLKMTLVTLLLGVLGMNVLLVGGMGWLIHYLKYKTLCKIHPHLVQSHSHVYDSDPADYSQFLGSSFSNSYNPSSAHDVNANGYSKDWSRTSNPYHGYNYLDTISKRVQ